MRHSKIKREVKVKIYYAHHLWKYDTEIEQYELDLIRKNFPGAEIINPNGDIPHKIHDEDSIMADCLKVVDECDILVFSSLSGVIGKGVHDEVTAAFRKLKDIYQIRRNCLKYVQSINFEIINNGENRRLYAIV